MSGPTNLPFSLITTLGSLKELHQPLGHRRSNPEYAALHQSFLSVRV